MEYLEGAELLDIIVMSHKINLKLSEDVLRYIVSKLLYTICRLHMLGIAHRDIKLENIMLTSDFEIKIVDFGLSGQMMGQTGQGFMNTCVGTLQYLAPEVRTGQYQGADADLFSLGVLLFICHFVKPPFAEAANGDKKYLELTTSPEEYLQSHCQGVECSDQLRDLIAIMLQPIPAARLSLVDFIGHDWFSQKPIMSKDDFALQISPIMAAIAQENAEKKLMLP